MKRTEMFKTNHVVYISYGMHGCIKRRVWMDNIGNEFVKVNGEWFNLWEVYGSNRTYTVTKMYEPVGK